MSSYKLDELSSSSTQLHLFLSIITLMLLLRFFGVSPDLFDIALFSCISMPATYALTYYHADAYKAGRFVVRKKPEPVRLWVYEVIALLSSFVMGYLVFVALSGSTDYVLFGMAFAVVQVMRLLLVVTTRHLEALGVDVRHPMMVVLISLGVATIGFVGLSMLFTMF